MCAASAHPEFIASELKKLVGHGASPHRLAVSPRLRELSGVNGGRPEDVGNFMRRWLTKRIATLDGPHVVDSEMVEAPELQKACLMLLRLGAYSRYAEVRRYDVIVLLKIHCSIEKWRRPIGPERELMQILAVHLTKTA